MEFSLAMHDRTPKTYVVLGGHRSGTSFIVNCLKLAGVPIVGSPPRLEDLRFVRLNMKIIQDAGGIWLHPPDEEALRASGEKYADEIKALIKEAGEGKPYWGWKDPRQDLTISSYLPHLEDDVYLIAIFRKPQKAGESLHKLQQVQTVERGVELAREYDNRLIRAIEEFVNG